MEKSHLRTAQTVVTAFEALSLCACVITMKLATHWKIVACLNFNHHKPDSQHSGRSTPQLSLSDSNDQHIEKHCWNTFKHFCQKKGLLVYEIFFIHLAILIRAGSNVVNFLCWKIGVKHSAACVGFELVRNYTGTLSHIFVGYLLFVVTMKVHFNSKYWKTLSEMTIKWRWRFISIFVLMPLITAIILPLIVQQNMDTTCWMAWKHTKTTDTNISSGIFITITFYIYLMILYVWILFMLALSVKYCFYKPQNKINNLKDKYFVIISIIYAVMIIICWGYATVRRMSNALNKNLYDHITDVVVHSITTSLYGVISLFVFCVMQYCTTKPNNKKDKPSSDKWSSSIDIKCSSTEQITNRYNYAAREESDELKKLNGECIELEGPKPN